jgi:streptogramin lyase
MRLRTAISTLFAVLVLTMGGTSAQATGPSVLEFVDGLPLGVGLWGIAEGPDGNLWFTEETHNAVGKITPGGAITEFADGFPTGSNRGIAVGPDGNLWVAQAGGDGAIARVTKAGVVTEFPVPTPGDPEDVAAGPDGNIWYVDSAVDVVGRVTPDGSITEFTDIASGAGSTAITKGPDGAMWFTESSKGRIGRIEMDGSVTEFDTGSGSDVPTDIVKGPDGNLWFTLRNDGGAIGRMTPEGDVMLFTSGLSIGSSPRGIAAGPDGALWFTESAIPGRIGRITTEGEITEYSAGLLALTDPWQIAPGPDGNMWFTGRLSGAIGRISLPPFVRDVDADQLTTSSARLRAKVRPNAQETDYHFEYGTKDILDKSTPLVSAGNAPHLDYVAATVEGLQTNSEYFYRVVATNDSGTTVGPLRSFTTLLPEQAARDTPAHGEPAQKTEKLPEFAETVVAVPVGEVRFKAPGGTWHTLEEGAELPLGVALDAREGKVNLQSEGCGGAVQTGVFGGGVFSVRQPRSGCGRVDVYLEGGSFAACDRPGGREARRGAKGRRASASRSRKVRRLWGRDSGGKFRSHGRNSHATVRGTRWLTVDRCDGTFTRVTEGAVVVKDFARDRRVLVRAGEGYLARSRSMAAKRRRR